MALAITKVSAESGAEAAVCQVNAINGLVVTGCWIDKGIRPIDNLNIQLDGWANPQTLVKVWSSRGSFTIAYKFDGPSYEIQQSIGGQVTTLKTVPLATTSLALTIAGNGLLSISVD